MITLVSLTESEFLKYWERDIVRYANENIVSGRWKKNRAIDLSRLEHKNILTKGLSIRNQYIYSIRSSKKKEIVGYVWYSIQKEKKISYCFIYDLIIEEKYRRKGYATDTLIEIEKILLKMDINLIKLHVFSHNVAAENLYKKSGFIPYGVSMMKKVITNK